MLPAITTFCRCFSGASGTGIGGGASSTSPYPSSRNSAGLAHMERELEQW
ncbi:hypothetical protein J0A67_04630 [Algoriphagus aestuariicola]|uniref:Uncharacterized protein n=1 Tax=Algoriphagus aestuariicola TaxID=1852016 RepID=A0ABS3BLG3_9BACT|nr:hypothetical protein [Algoriphagus aestuariicola]MBN7800133.1 hypothetical protein [Algoriphagus aestuariicola]